MKKHFFLICVLYLANLISCSSNEVKGQRIFEVKAGYHLKPGTIAIVPATLDNVNVLLAEHLYRSFIKETNFNVVPYNKIYSLLPKDRNLISSFGQPPTDDVNKYVYWLSQENKATLKWFQKKVKTRYIFLVWSNGRGSTNTYNFKGEYLGSSYGFLISGRLLEFTNNDVVGCSFKFFTSNPSRLLSIGNSDSDNYDDLIKEASTSVAKEVMKTIKNQEK